MSSEHDLLCEKCKLPFARVVAGALVIESRHHGKKHTNVVSISELVEIARKQGVKVAR